MNKKIENIREKLIEVSIQQFLTKGYAGAATMEIARLAGVSKGALYYYFKSKEDILGAVVDKYSDEFIRGAINRIDDCNGDFPAKFKAFYRFSTEFARENRELLSSFTAMLMEFAGSGSDVEKRLKSVNEQYIMIIERLIDGGIREGTVSKDIDPTLYGRYFAGTMMGSHLQWYLHQDDTSFSRRIATLQRDALLNIVMLGDHSRMSEAEKVATRSDRRGRQ